MDVNFFYNSIDDRFIIYEDNMCMRAFVNLFIKKLSCRNYRLDFHQISQDCFLDRG